MMNTRRACRSGAGLPRPLRQMLALASVALAACTSQPLVGRYVAADTGCCARVADYPFAPLALGQEVAFSLTPATPTLTMAGLRGHLAGFRVADGVVATAATLKSYLSSDFLPKATAVAPELYFYDAQFQPLGQAAVGDMQSDNGFWRGSVSGRVAVPSHTRYIVVMASTGEAGRGLVRSENGTPYHLPPAALGDLSIRLFGEGAAR